MHDARMKKHHALPLLASITLAAALLSAGCSSDTDPPGDGDGDGDGDDTSGQFPADTTEATVAAFLAAESYKTWTGDAAPRGSEDTVNVHGDFLRVFFNDNAVTSHGGPASPQSMVVKEIYDAQGTLLGKATTIIDADLGRTFYCSVTSGTGCTGQAETEPLYDDISCSSCHGGQFYAPLPL